MDSEELLGKESKYLRDFAVGETTSMDCCPGSLARRRGPQPAGSNAFWGMILSHAACFVAMLNKSPVG